MRVLRRAGLPHGMPTGPVTESALSSAVEHQYHTLGVAGSNPAARTSLVVGEEEVAISLNHASARFTPYRGGAAQTVALEEAFRRDG